jgi:hypothetical protein
MIQPPNAWGDNPLNAPFTISKERTDVCRARAVFCVVAGPGVAAHWRDSSRRDATDHPAYRSMIGGAGRFQLRAELANDLADIHLF